MGERNNKREADAARRFQRRLLSRGNVRDAHIISIAHRRRQFAKPRWLVVEALTRKMRDDPALWGVPGTHVAARALDQQGYLDAPGYLKTPRIFGFTGVYKRLAIHLGVIDIHLGAGPNAEGLVESWARGLHSDATERFWRRSRTLEPTKSTGSP